MHLNLTKLFLNNVTLKTFKMTTANMKSEDDRVRFQAEFANYKLQEVVLGLPIVTETTQENFAKQNLVDLLYR